MLHLGEAADIIWILIGLVILAAFLIPYLQKRRIVGNRLAAIRFYREETALACDNHNPPPGNHDPPRFSHLSLYRY